MKSCADALEAHVAMQQDKELVERAMSAYDEAIKEQLSKSEAMTAEAEQIEKECTSLGGRLSSTRAVHSRLTADLPNGTRPLKEGAR